MTVKTVLISTTLFSAIAFVGSSVAQDATDYGALSNEQLIQMRSEERSMSAEDQARFRTEMQTRAQNMTAEERAQAGLGPRNADSNGQGTQTQKRDGTGGRDRSADRKRDGSGYGGGYQSRRGQGGGRGGR
jgi:hypothetical protein